jgi:hypothetical protein
VTRLEELKQLVYDNGIDIYNRRISKDKKGFFFDILGDKSIALDDPAICDECEGLVVLAEEYAHYATHGYYMVDAAMNSPMHRGIRSKMEARSRHWAYGMILPPDLIQAAIDSEYYYGWKAVAEYCGVTVEFLFGAAEYYRSVEVSFDFPDSDSI